MTTLILVRHGETDWNRARRIQGATDIPLNDTGRVQARTAAAALHEELPAGSPVVLASSDLQRARETAEIMGLELALPAPLIYPAFRERAYGEAEGLTDTEYAQRWDGWHAEVPGSESPAIVRERALAGIDAVVRDTRELTAPVSPIIVVVSHGALIRQVIRYATSGALPSDGVRLGNGSRHTFLIERERMTLVASPVLDAVAA